MMLTSTFIITWIDIPVAKLTLANVLDTESIRSLVLEAITDNTLLLELLGYRLRMARYRRSDGPTPESISTADPLAEPLGTGIASNWGMTSYADVCYLLSEYFNDPWSFKIPEVEPELLIEDEIDGVMMS